jgi:hypothetical protein
MAGTQGASTTGLEPIEQDATGGQSTSTQGGEFQGSGPVSEALRNVPSLFQFLENNFSFFAVMLSVFGYVIIAAFGGMENLGQYLGYVVFLCCVFTIYSFKKWKNNGKTYLFSGVIILLVGLLCFQNWSLLSNGYTALSKYFEKPETTTEATTTPATQAD